MHNKSCNYGDSISDQISEKIARYLHIFCILSNARKLGWNAKIHNGQIILTKKINSQNDTDRDTPTLIQLLAGI
jgi:hypothetical protein